MSSVSIHASSMAKIGEGGWPVTLKLLLMRSWDLQGENFCHASPIQALVKIRLSEADRLCDAQLSKLPGMSSHSSCSILIRPFSV